MHCNTPGFLVHHQLPALAQIHFIESVMSSNRLVVCGPLLLLHSFFPSIRVFSKESALHIRWPKSQLFTSDGQSIGTSASASVLTMNIQGWFLLGLTGLISLQSKGLSRVLPNTKIQKHQFSSAKPSLWSNSHIHTWLLEIYHSNLWFWKSQSKNLQAHQQTHLRESLW